MQLEVITQEPKSCISPVPILFVHGMWHSAWCWSEYFLPYFAQHGYQSHALSLRGHGASDGREKLRWTSLAEYVDDVAQVVSELQRPTILVGHSMGGVVVQKYLESHQAPAAVLMASIPPKGIFAGTMRIAWRHPLIVLKASLIANSYPVIGTPSRCKEYLFSDDISDEKLKIYFELMQDESHRAYLDMAMFNLPKPEQIKTQILVLGAAQDKSISSSEVKATAFAYNTKEYIFPDIAHDMMLESKWQVVADRILYWLKENVI